MGLALSVGYLADVKGADEEGAAHVREQFEKLNRFLRSQGLPPHGEPEDIVPLSFGMYGYSGLHYLRRIAAHVEAGKPLPAPGGKDASKDPVLLQRYAQIGRRPNFLGRLFGLRPSAFPHLLDHSDAEGYYLPQDFANVLVAGEEWEIAGAYIGSSPRLLAECEKLAGLLELPLDLDPESEEVELSPESQGEGDVKWKRYGVESFNCLRLHAAAKHSIKTGAALVFC